RLKRFELGWRQRRLLNIRLRLRRPRCWDNDEKCGRKNPCGCCCNGQQREHKGNDEAATEHRSTPQHKTLYHLEPSAYKVSQCICGEAAVKLGGAIRTGEHCGVHYSIDTPAKARRKLGFSYRWSCNSLIKVNGAIPTMGTAPHPLPKRTIRESAPSTRDTRAPGSCCGLGRARFRCRAVVRQSPDAHESP